MIAIIKPCELCNHWRERCCCFSSFCQRLLKIQNILQENEDPGTSLNEKLDENSNITIGSVNHEKDLVTEYKMETQNETEVVKKEAMDTEDNSENIEEMLQLPEEQSLVIINL